MISLKNRLKKIAHALELRRAKSSFFDVLRLYKKRRGGLAENRRLEVRRALNRLQKAILARDRDAIERWMGVAKSLQRTHLKRPLFSRISHSLVSLLIALACALLIRGIWFELYEIPSGSMRPTLKEGDRLIVSKTTFGINTPFMRRHFYFDPKLVERNGIVIFTGKGIDTIDTDTYYLYLFPGKKQYVKRLIGKPGDTLYFYGGMIYGIDDEGNDISPQLQTEKLQAIDHIPYIHLRGKSSPPRRRKERPSHISFTIKQMNREIARIDIDPFNRAEGELLPPYSEHFKDYYEIWGLGNYGMGRLLTQSEAIALSNTDLSDIEKTPLYMEIFHHPSILYPTTFRDQYAKIVPSVGISSTLLPLEEEHLQTLFRGIYTSRFIVKRGAIHRLNNPAQPLALSPKVEGVPDGMYEIERGRGYAIKWGGIRKALPPDHPLLTYSHDRLQLLYNLGIECNTLFSPQSKNPLLLPGRYIYFRSGDLYSMGGPFMHRDDPLLAHFLERESLKKENAPNHRPYIPFIDSGPPTTKRGDLDTAFLQNNGLHIPPDRYLVLGDNSPVSADSREFGCISEKNIRGAPSFLFWPPGERFGLPNQSPYPLFNLPRLCIWALASTLWIGWRVYRKIRHRLPAEIP